MNTPKPIKRHQAILKFSQEHHFGLLLVWKIREGLKKNIETERIALYTNFIFEKNLEQHFKEEESLLFTRIDDKEPLKQRVIEEHQKIYLAIEDLKKGNHSTETLHNFADLLDKHIRFEERELFNYLQQHLSESQLSEIAAQHQSEKIKDVDGQWADHFWLHK
jgi:hemerythrin-like domain-containing protein